MLLINRSRRIRGLMLSWLAYWIVLFTITLGPAVVAMWRVTHGPSTDKNDILLNASSLVIGLVVKSNGRVAWSGSAHLGTIAAWIAAGPLALWLVWLALGSRRTEHERASEKAGEKAGKKVSV